MLAEPPGLWSAFTARAELLGAVVVRAATEAGVVALIRETAGEFACTRSVEDRFPDVAASASAAAQPDVVGAAEFGVAETGSVAVNEPASDRGRCFLAERLWLLVGQDALVPDLDAALQRMGQLIRAGARHPLLMSGPSRTADIERVLTIGVHGPRALTIVIVGGESPGLS
ncbi:MAG: LUD domain-containing protein [Chloroflexi bacterium]|nr:LUD domain-containing protein [Chloroflexota bacterium]MBV9596171.1 LUD domain-containing protein [Chloroflexota bacterium]